MNFYIFNSNPAEMDRYSSYLRQIFFLTLFFLLTIGGFNFVVDPFKLFGLLEIENFNRLKPEFSSHIRLAKANAIRQLKPDALILGSSRAEAGLDPDHPGWNKSVVNTYNLALQSANINEIFQYLKHAQSIQPLKQVVIGLDFFMFNANKQDEADFSQSRLEPSNFLPIGWYKDIYQALFTLDGTISSFKTISSQENTHSVGYFDNGFRDDSNKWKLIKRKGGHLKVAQNNERNSLSAFDGFIFFSLYAANSKEMPGLKIFEEILDFCDRNKIDLHLFISPLHGRKQEIIYQIGLWQDFENWKRQMVRIIADHPSNYPLWDFTGFNKITTEKFPLSGDNKSQMKWYWESSHYKKEAGNIILNSLFQDSLNSSHQIRLNDFGLRLYADNLEQHLLSIKQKHSDFEATYPEIKLEINSMIVQTIPQRDKLYLLYPNIKPLKLLHDFQKTNQNLISKN